MRYVLYVITIVFIYTRLAPDNADFNLIDTIVAVVFIILLPTITILSRKCEQCKKLTYEASKANCRTCGFPK